MPQTASPPATGGELFPELYTGWRPDSDGDEVWDGEEVAAGTDPTVPGDRPGS